jgi:hypothetical protein
MRFTTVKCGDERYWLEGGGRARVRGAGGGRVGVEGSTSVIAFYEKIIKVKADVAAYLN